ncbi:hypothetical protein ABZ478_38955 [Streptomyces sp. NPDC005706]|uniref:hypothetical protein n=1 Tax=Streptomyces sp. NPDC005706 TaxID=3157169 RepID=UPI003406BC02
MADEDAEGFTQDGYLEDTYVTDLGLTWLASRWEVLDALSEEDARCHLPAGGPVAEWLGFAELAVDEFDRSKAVRLGQDVQRLLRSSLPDETIRRVWLAATHGVFDPSEYGMSAGAWLRRVEQAWLTRVRQDDAAFVPPPPQPVVDEELRRGVLQVIRPVAEPLGLAAGRPAFGVPSTGLVPALERVVTESCADLGFRLFLRAMKAYHVPADRPRLVALGERFGYPRWVVPDGLNDRTD